MAKFQVRWLLRVANLSASRDQPENKKYLKLAILQCGLVQIVTSLE